MHVYTCTDDILHVDISESIHGRSEDVYMPLEQSMMSEDSGKSFSCFVPNNSCTIAMYLTLS